MLLCQKSSGLSIYIYLLRELHCDTTFFFASPTHLNSECAFSFFFQPFLGFQFCPHSSRRNFHIYYFPSRAFNQTLHSPLKMMLLLATMYARPLCYISIFTCVRADVKERTRPAIKSGRASTLTYPTSTPAFAASVF